MYTARCRIDAQVGFLLTASLVVSLVVFCNRAARASFVVDFAFDPSDAGFSAATPNVLNLVPGQAAATYHIDIFGTAFADSPQPPSNFQLQQISMRAFDDGGNAFSTGAGIGAAAGSFAPAPAFTVPGFLQPNVSDMGKTTTSGATVTAGADGILDFGDTTPAQKLTFFASPPAAGSGSGSVMSFTWLLGTFDFTVGTAGLSPGSTTRFWPTILAAGQGSATAAQYTTTGGAITGGPVTLSSAALTFTVVPEPTTNTLFAIGLLLFGARIIPVLWRRRSGARSFVVSHESFADDA
jgi:hypothetical protein